MFFLSDVGTGIGNAFFRSDGSSPAVILNGANEYQSAASARQQGFFVLTHSHEQPWCQYVRPLDADAMGSPALAVASDPDAINALIGNPRGGYVEQRTINHANPDMSETESRLQLRWLYEDLAPAGPWQTVYTLRGLGQTAYHRVFVDDRGLALVLSFVHPPSFGPPPPPSQWSFNARWVGPSGPIGDSFTPAAPTFTAKTGMAYFANWGTAVALEGGGFALFHAPARDPGGGSLSATGWYAFYPSGKASFENPPAWLARYDASLHLVAGDGFPMYAASRKDPDTCARVAQLIAPSGEACFELRLPDSNLCDAQDTFSADGTLVSQNNCQVRWWPKLARAGASHWAAAVRAWLSFSRTTEVP